jgi:predicted N-acetyltransferase YhbS
MLTVRAAQSDDLVAIGCGHLLTRPGFQPAMCRVGVLGGQIISHAVTERITLVYGRARLRVVGLGNVFTAPEYRQQGHSAAVMRDALAYSMEQGAHLALLHDDTCGYFQQFGFGPIWPQYTMEFSSELAASLGQPLTLRPARPDDLPQIAALYDRLWLGRVTFQRSPQLWAWRMSVDASGQALVTQDTRGQVRGYIYGHDLVGDAVEVVAETAEAVITLLAESGRMHHNSGHSTVRWPMPPDDLIIYYARQVLDVTLSAAYLLAGGWLARMIDTAGLVEALLPEITTEAAQTLPDFDPDALVIDCRSDRVRIGLSGREATFCYLNHPDFIQIVFGSLNPALGIYAGMHPDSVRLLQALFPPRVATLGRWDWF